ncbi:hypothetical protein, partial [Agrobacterium tumefaciens]|uniref:hypothetical protein n=1 Tax=Agrobacterium tumefaciens TaxID=358 RepID=UPI001AEC7E03
HDIVIMVDRRSNLNSTPIKSISLLQFPRITILQSDQQIQHKIHIFTRSRPAIRKLQVRKSQFSFRILIRFQSRIYNLSQHIFYMFPRWLLYKYMFTETAQIAAGLPSSCLPMNQDSPFGCVNIAS